MARYLSAEWIDGVCAAAKESDELREASRGVRLTVQQQVTGGPDGDVSYHVVLDDGAVEVRPGNAPAPDVTFLQDHATAVAVATGELPGQAAFMTGKLRVSGNVELLMRQKSTFAGLDRALAAVRQSTEYR